MQDEALSDLHPMADLLASCPGMTKEDVYYLEQRGYIRPIKQRHGRVERNLYTTEQFELVKAIWVYRKEGFRPREAYKKALSDRNRGQLEMWPEEEDEGAGGRP